MNDFLFMILSGLSGRIKALIILLTALCAVLIHLHSNYCTSRYYRGYDRVWDDPVFKNDIILSVIVDSLAALLALAALSFI